MQRRVKVKSIDSNYYLGRISKAIQTLKFDTGEHFLPKNELRIIRRTTFGMSPGK